MREDVTYTLGELAERLSIECVGDREMTITGLATLACAGPQQLSFLANPRYKKDLCSSRAGAIIIAEDMREACPTAALVSTNPYLSYAKASQLFDTHHHYVPGEIHASAVVDASATIHPSVSIGPNSVIGVGVRVGANTCINAGVVIGDHSVLGDGCLIHANATLYHGVNIGDRVILHSGSVLGSDGFGFAPSPQGYEKIAQLGGVVVGNDVEIGAGTTIDRGALDDTVIANGVIIDNQVQIAHNVHIGEQTAIAGKVGIAGSTHIGRQCTIAGGVGLVGHITLADKVHVTAHTVVTKSINQSGSYSSGTSMQETSLWRKNAARLSQLDGLARRLFKLEKAHNK